MQQQQTESQRATCMSDVKKAVNEPALDGIVEWAFNAARSLGFEVFHIPSNGQDGEQSSVNWDDHAIYVSPNGLAGTARLWDLLHEIGHAHQGRPREGYKCARTAECFAREEHAWDLAWVRASQAHPRLVAYETAFQAHAQLMASSYQPPPMA